MLENDIFILSLCGALATCFVAIYWYFSRIFTYWKKRNVPYLSPIIPLGNILKILTRHRTLGDGIGDMYLEFKRRGCKHAGIYVLNAPVYLPIDENIIKRILISDADNFPNRGLYINTQDDPLSSHLFSAEGNRWKDVRAKLPQAFTTAKMRQMFTMMVNFVDELKTQLDICQKLNPKGINIKNELIKFSVDVNSTCAFGLESNAMKGKNKDLIKYAREFFDYQLDITKNAMIFAFSRNILKLFNFRVFTKDATKYVTKMYLELKEYRRKFNIQREDIANAILKLTDKTKELKDYKGKHVMNSLSENEYVAHMWVFFCAGFETSSTTVTFALYELAKNPEIQKKLRDDINKVLTRYDNQICYDAIMEMKYLECVVDETLRKYPVLPILLRVCKEDYKVPDTDLTIEKGTFVIVSNYGIQMDPEYYPDPEKFNPERFTNENKSSRSFISHMPFGEGPRICIGKRFGLLQTKVALMTIIRNYEVTLSEKTSAGCSFDPWKMILRKTGDVWVSLKKIQ